MKTKWYIHRVVAICLLMSALAFLGCSGDDGKRGPPGPTPEDLARGIDSPNSSLCFSCHQHEGVGVLSATVLRAHMDNMGGEMFGGSAHGKEPKEGCIACHGDFRPGQGSDGLSESLHAGFQHQRDRADSVWGASVDSVVVDAGVVEVSFTIEDARYVDAPDEVNVELTIAKEVSEGSWMNMLQRTRERGAQDDPLYGDGVKVIRGGNLRLEDGDILGGGVDVDGGTQFTTPLLADPGDYGNETGRLNEIDFSGGVVWRRAGDDVASSYGEGADYRAWVREKINEINANGALESGTYRISITGRDRDSGYVRFAAVADFDLVGTGAGATVAAASIDDPKPTNQIEQASCNTCHGDRLSFPRNRVHGEQRPDVNTCFNCHNDYTWDSRNSYAEVDGWARLDMTTMVHSIHSGIDGYVADAYLYEDVSYPDWTLAGTSNCASCHIGEVPAEGEGWNRRDPTIVSTCATCHGEGGYAFDTPATEDHGAFFSYNCSGCHDGSIRVGFDRAADAIHGVSARLEELRVQREDFHFELVGVENAVYRSTPVVRWQVLDAAFNPIELTDEMIDGGPRVHIGWGYGDDWTNEGSGEKSDFRERDNDDGGRPVAVNVSTGGGGNTVIDGDTAITTFPAFTNSAAGGGQGFADLKQAYEGRHGFVAIHRSINANGETRLLTSRVHPIVLGSGEVQMAESRRTSVNATTNIDHATNRGGSCLSCHGTIAWHGNGYTADNNIHACITCHNAGSHTSIAATHPDAPYSVDMMYLMHQAHSDPEILYPQDMPGRCHACHAGSNEPHPTWLDDDGFLVDINVNVGEKTNCTLCHVGEMHEGRLGIISAWPGSIEEYGLRGDGTDDGTN